MKVFCDNYECIFIDECGFCDCDKLSIVGGVCEGSYHSGRNAVDKSRYEQLFGTPERAAEYFAMQCFGSDGGLCCYCPFDDCDEGLRNMGSYPSVHSKLLDWLRGDE